MDRTQAVAKAVRALEGRFDIRKATVLLSDRETVKVHRRHRPTRRDSRIEFVVTMGAPNYEETRLIRACKRAKEPLPCKRVLLKPWAPKKAKAKR